MSDSFYETAAKVGITLIDKICQKYELKVEMTTDFNEIEEIVGKSLPEELRQDLPDKVDLNRNTELAFLCHYACFKDKLLELNSSDFRRLVKDSDTQLIEQIFLFIKGELS